MKKLRLSSLVFGKFFFDAPNKVTHPHIKTVTYAVKGFVSRLSLAPFNCAEMCSLYIGETAEHLLSNTLLLPIRGNYLSHGHRIKSRFIHGKLVHPPHEKYCVNIIPYLFAVYDYIC